MLLAGLLSFAIMSNYLARRHPLLAARWPVAALTDLPTPVSTRRCTLGGRQTTLLVKHDDKSGSLYGGNKVRKLEYLIQRALDRNATRVATYGAAGSNHALATAIYARHAGLECTCLLSHQAPKPAIARTLLAHQQLGTEVLYFGGPLQRRLAIQRRSLQHRNIFLLPLGGTCWLGNLGYINAALEFAAQLEQEGLPCPERLYVAFGSMGTAAGLALGFALARLPLEIHAVRVTDPSVANEKRLRHLLLKTVRLMHQFDPGVPPDLAERTNVRIRDEFFASGYGRSNPATERAIRIARDDLGLQLEATYTGKAMAALLHDIESGAASQPVFWNTYNSLPVSVPDDVTPDFDHLPAEFARYFD